MPTTRIDSEILRAALIGYESQLASLDEKISAIRTQLNPAESLTGSPAAPPSTKRVLSAGARRRIAAAQRKRWAALRAQSKQAATTAPAKKSRISPEARKRIIAATKKRWAEYRAKKAAGA